MKFKLKFKINILNKDNLKKISKNLSARKCKR